MNFLRIVINLAVLLCVIRLGQGLPVDNVSKIEDPEESGGYFEGDMDLDNVQRGVLRSMSRNGVLMEQYRWPNHQVDYKFNGAFDKAHTDYILAAMKIIETETCIKFLPATDTTTAYISITSTDTGCHSTVGYRNNVQGVNLQIFPLDYGCFRLGSIQHELLHALGFYHQQSTYDRDQFVQIHEENIIKGKEFNFDKYSQGIVSNFGSAYDYESVMHYSAYAFSKNGEKTIEPLQNFNIGQRNSLSPIDIQKINVMYKCPFYT